jgi:sugar lactone lactonase YvrE
MAIKATLAISARDEIGEGPLWDAKHQRLLWLDHQVGIIHEARAAGLAGWRETQRWNLNRHIAAAIPRQRGGLVVAAGTELLLFDEITGKITPFVTLDVDPALIRLNDAKCDSHGRIWAGTLATDISRRAALYRIDPNGAVTTMLEGVAIANGLDWSPDGSIFYFIDSIALTIDAFKFDMARGTLGERRTLVSITHGEGGANGMTVDLEGCLWVAVTGGGEVRRYSPDGALLDRVTISTSGATSCAFGGADCAELFITSRSGRMPEFAHTLLGVPLDRLEDNGPAAGGLFVCRPGATGAPAMLFAA